MKVEVAPSYGVPVLKLYDLCGRKVTLTLWRTSELRSCVKVGVAPSCGPPDLNKLYDLCGRKVINIDNVEDFRAQELCASRGGAVLWAPRP